MKKKEIKSSVAKGDDLHHLVDTIKEVESTV